MAYTLPVQDLWKLKAIKFYNDYSYFDKERSDWSASQLNTTGMMLIASPFLVWVDYTWGKMPILLVDRPIALAILLQAHKIVTNGCTGST